MSTLDDERAALRERQGTGARRDAEGAPAETLLWARLGTAYFARLLNDLSGPDLDAPSLVPDWSRRYIVAQVGYHARALTRLTGTAAGAPARLMYASDAARRAEIEGGASLPDHALRGLFHHAAVHLDVEWRDLRSDQWDTPVGLETGAVGPISETPWLRAREIWLRALQLSSGGSVRDFPPRLVDRLLRERTGPSFTPKPASHCDAVAFGTGDGPILTGPAAGITDLLYGLPPATPEFVGEDPSPTDPSNHLSIKR